MIPQLAPMSVAVKRAIIELRDYQAAAEAEIHAAWVAGAKNVLAVLPTGAGKTVLVSKILHDEPGEAWAIAHRSELVGQIALALARNGVRHKIIGPTAVIRACVNRQMRELGASFYDPNARVAVCGVDTLVQRKEKLIRSAAGVRLWVIDEAHHCTGGTSPNKWGKAVQMFPNARGLGVTATPTRADGKGLGRHADGVFDAMVEGPTQRELIRRGYLTDYKIYAPPSDIDLSAVKIGATGDYSPRGLAQAAEKSRIVGDVVEHYLRLAPGKRGVTFATDVETAGRIADKFNAAGVPAAVVHAGTPEAERTAAVQRLTSGRLLQLVNVDIFGEGFDLPAIEVVSFARPTQSFSLFVQQAGRALRPAPGKSHAIIIDHVGNVSRHATVVERGGELVIELCHRTWTLDAREKRGKREREPGEIPLTTCPECLGSYPRAYPRCLYCGHVPVPAGRGSPEEVDGDLTLLDPRALAELQRRIERVDMDVETYGNELARKGVPHAGVLANKKRLKKQQDAQHVLRENIAWWAGYQRALGRPDGEIYRRFYFRFGTDVRSAQTLNESDALALAEKLAENFTD